MSHTFHRSLVYLACGSLLALSACGGGGSAGGGGLGGLGGLGPDLAPASPPPATVTVSGKVFILGPIGNATVCIDRNKNNACDADEPGSGKTGADGTYSFSYTPVDAAEADALAAAPLLAQLAGGTVADGASYEAGAPSTPLIGPGPVYNLSAPAGRRAQINPLTTLVQTGVESGLSLARSEASVSIQLGVTAAEIYDYPSTPVDSAGFTDDARTMAHVTNLALSYGTALNVVDAAALADPVPSTQLASLNFTSPSEYSARTIVTDGVPDANGELHYVDTRVGMTAGAPSAHNVLYAQARLTPTGWVRCDETSKLTAALGTPSRSDFCGEGSPSVSFSTAYDMAGQKMADFVRAVQLMPNSTIVGLSPSAGFSNPDAVFPADSQARLRTSVDLSQLYFINNTNTDGSGFPTLAALIAARPASGVNLASGGGTMALGVIDDGHILRGAFIDGTSVQYYSCESTAPLFLTIGNCIPAGVGAYAVETVNGVKVLALGEGYPSTSVSYQRSFAEYSGGAYMVRKPKPKLRLSGSFVVDQRLNGVAWDAMKAQIGL